MSAYPTIHVLAPAEGQGAARYPRREVIFEFTDRTMADVVEEVSPPAGGWLVAWDGHRVFHFASENGKWRFQSMAVGPRPESMVDVETGRIDLAE